MQRWIMIGVIVAALGGIGLLGGYTWLQNDRANRPHRIWVPIPLNVELTHEQHEKFAADLHKRLSTDQVLAEISTDLGLRTRSNFATEEDSIADLRKRLVCEVGEYNYAPSLNIGFNGVRHENTLLQDLTERLMKDVDQVIRARAPLDSP